MVNVICINKYNEIVLYNTKLGIKKGLLSIVFQDLVNVPRHPFDLLF